MKRLKSHRILIPPFMAILCLLIGNISFLTSTKAASETFPIEKIMDTPPQKNDMLHSLKKNQKPAIMQLKGEPLIETHSDDRKEIILSIYHDNFAFVREVREITFPTGPAELRYWDIPSGINPASVRIKTLHSTGGVSFLEQNYEYHPITPQRLMDHYVGHKIKLLEKDDFSGTQGSLEAELVSYQQDPIYRIGSEIHIGHPGRVVLPELPEHFTDKPSLLWRLSTTTAGLHPLEVTYLTEGLDWDVDYAILLNDDNTRGDLSAWITIHNNSDTKFQNAHIQLLAGEVSRIREPRLIRMREAEDSGALLRDKTEEGLFEYHIYDIPEKTTLKGRQTKQIHLFTSDRIPIKKELRYYGAQSYYRQRYPDSERPQKVGVYLEFENRKTFHLGIPLPAGIMRVYQKDSKGFIQFLGENRVSHTPEDEKVRVKTGYASDLTVERRQMDWRRPTSDILEVAWEIILRNHKDESAWIVVMESLPGDWEVKESTHHWKKEEAHTLRFDLSVAPSSKEMIHYRVRTHF